MKVSRSLLLAALIIVVSSAGLRLGYEARKTRVGTRVLFVGNSFTFVNNLPAVFAALASANGFPVATDMLVRSGAALTDRIADTSLPRLLEKQHYDYVVLQERAGAVLCGQPHEKGSADPCGLSRQAHRQSADLARAHGAEPIVLGTYASAELAQAMQTNESFLAREVGATYIPIAERLVRAAVPERPMAQPAPTARIIDGKIYAERLRREAANLRTAASFGLCVADFSSERAQELQNFESLIKVSDDLLYKAKLNGRNRIEHEHLC